MFCSQEEPCPKSGNILDCLYSKTYLSLLGANIVSDTLFLGVYVKIPYFFLLILLVNK